MREAIAQEIIEDATRVVAERSHVPTDGKWLEDITVEAGPHIKEWDIEQCYRWSEWPERESRFPGTSNKDLGIDIVGIRRSDGERIAIQCKSRQLDEQGRGQSINKQEMDSFASVSSHSFWAERWIVTNGDNPLNRNAQQANSMLVMPIKMINIAIDLQQQQEIVTHDECPHCLPNPDGEPRIQSKSCMQDEAVAQSIRILREHELSESGGLPSGQARGKLILPCGTGKTRISLRIIEKLTPRGKLSVVLCPSIALVAQIRREYLQNTIMDIRLLAVCSDQTAGYDPKKEGIRNTATDPTVDNSNVSELEVKGKVTTEANEIAEWIQQGKGTTRLNIIIGTYQSSYKVAEALQLGTTEVQVLVADEAHRRPVCAGNARRMQNSESGTLHSAMTTMRFQQPTVFTRPQRPAYTTRKSGRAEPMMTGSSAPWTTRKFLVLSFTERVIWKPCATNGYLTTASLLWLSTTMTLTRKPTDWRRIPGARGEAH